MIGPSVDPASVGATGLLWLFLSYGYALYYAANLIGEGSELLLLVPSMAGLVGGVVLPLLGAVPDGAIILFSGLGSLEEAQETLSVGVGALAGSTIMLLTVPWAVAVYSGRVDVENGKARYLQVPKLAPKTGIMEELTKTGVTISNEVQHGGIVMAFTTIPYFLIQVPASFLHGPTEEVAEGEHWWSLGAFCVCVFGLVYYMKLQLQFSDEGQDKQKRIQITKKVLRDGKMSLAGALQTAIQQAEDGAKVSGGEYQSLATEAFNKPPPSVVSYLKEVLKDAFMAYDKDSSGNLEKGELRLFFKDFHENIEEKDIDDLLQRADTDSDGIISFDEFIGLAYNLIKSNDEIKDNNKHIRPSTMDPSQRVAVGILDEDGDEDEEQEEMPEEFTDLSPDEQQKAIKRRAFRMLALGTVLVIYFSDPMVDVMQEIAVRAKLSPFYVSFVLAPLASNASEVIASQYYASKKTRKTIAVSLSALEGAASMNNTFCLSIFMCLIYFRGLAWQYSAETIAIVVVEIIMAVLVQKKVMTTLMGLIILSIFPLSLVLVATLEYFGLD
mmetsp:Transcript_52525/g.79714  ORF Transcript_52525/g.79714 Transcript_52525/m.79714 type:complete len:555 (+) Transcript_52525:129-1793(+)|eukprot:CAMPEP_0117049464 /NCGR_PEP_ID=MMETSP0472-20121206/34147_1 /TAXON_ID=693140 ORGANISM="Tiarina fusus, Strain LIS" /NCGR_SAMPLE_ID=MMETSP0472 /ASSEMBLY_ACC=CAM_ASM_000603 /LENGTH=554 /DNA_ID=CAMNT_0004762865 /DNA_START=129 /DNA_END=1793 /DNA_ORIENTATION=+